MSMFGMQCLLVTIVFDEILPASGWISSQNQKQRKRVTPEEPDEFPNHWAGGYSGWSLAVFHEKYLKAWVLKPDVTTLERVEKRLPHFPIWSAWSSSPPGVCESFWGSAFAKIKFQPGYLRKAPNWTRTWKSGVDRRPLHSTGDIWWNFSSCNSVLLLVFLQSPY